jgi:hypothetical protein
MRNSTQKPTRYGGGWRARCGPWLRAALESGSVEALAISTRVG